MNARASQLKKAQGSGLAGNFLSETTRPEAGSGLAEPDEVMKGKRGKQKQELSLDGWRGCFPQPWAARARLPPAETRAGTPEAKVVTPGSWAPKPWKRRVGVMGEIQPHGPASPLCRKFQVRPGVFLRVKITHKQPHKTPNRWSQQKQNPTE